MAVDLKTRIHSSFSKDSTTWSGFRSEITGTFINDKGTGVNYNDYSNHLIREYNEKISELGFDKLNSNLYIQPYDAGFRYTSNPLLGKYSEAAGAYSTKDIGFGGYLMQVRTDWDVNSSEEAYVLGDVDGNISLNSPVGPTGTGCPNFTNALSNALGTGSQLGPYEVITFQTGILGKQYKITYAKNAWYEDLSGYAITYKRQAASYWDNDLNDAAMGKFPLNLPNAPNGDSLRYVYGISYIGFAQAWAVNTKWAEAGDTTTNSNGYYVFEKEATAAGSAASANALNYVMKVEAVHETLEEWIGTSTGYVSTWYDQAHTGLAQNNLSQATAADQPILVNGGTLVTDSNGNTALDFDGSNQHLSLDTGFSSTLNINALSSYVVFEADTIAGNQMISCLGSFADSNKRWYCPYINSNNFTFNYGAGSAPSTSANTNLNLVSMVADSTQGSYKAFLNSSQVGSNGSLEDKSGGTSLVGAAGLGDSLHFNGKMGEFIIYSSSSASTNRISIESDINKRFKIY
jgi:hypothetical protein